MDFYILSIIVFIALLIVLIVKDKKKFKRDFIVLLRKTTRGREFIVRIGKTFPNLWKVLGNTAIFVGFMISIWTFWLIITTTLRNFLSEKAVPTVSIILPSFSSKPDIGLGYILVPFWQFIISAAVLIIVHEGLHGIMAARENVKIKSLGIGLLIFLPLAFVEPDERELRKKRLWSQLRVFASGSFANFIAGGFSLLLLSYMLGVPFIGLFNVGNAGIFEPKGVYYGGIIEGYPAEKVNLTGVIVAINNTQINTVENLTHLLHSIGPNKTIIIHTIIMNDSVVKNKTFSMITAEDPNNKSKGFIGITMVRDFLDIKEDYKNYKYGINFFVSLFQWMFLINLGVGAFNLLPIRFLDGGRMWEVVLKRLIGNKAKEAVNGLSYFLGFVILLNLFLGFGLL